MAKSWKNIIRTSSESNDNSTEKDASQQISLDEILKSNEEMDALMKERRELEEKVQGLLGTEKPKESNPRFPNLDIPSFKQKRQDEQQRQDFKKNLERRHLQKKIEDKTREINLWKKRREELVAKAKLKIQEAKRKENELYEKLDKVRQFNTKKDNFIDRGAKKLTDALDAKFNFDRQKKSKENEDQERQRKKVVPDFIKKRLEKNKEYQKFIDRRDAIKNKLKDIRNYKEKIDAKKEELKRVTCNPKDAINFGKKALSDTKKKYEKAKEDILKIRKIKDNWQEKREKLKTKIKEKTSFEKQREKLRERAKLKELDQLDAMMPGDEKPSEDIKRALKEAVDDLKPKKIKAGDELETKEQKRKRSRKEKKEEEDKELKRKERIEQRRKERQEARENKNKEVRQDKASDNDSLDKRKKDNSDAELKQKQEKDKEKRKEQRDEERKTNSAKREEELREKRRDEERERKREERRTIKKDKYS
jgi:hypothetical protein